MLETPPFVDSPRALPEPRRRVLDNPRVLAVAFALNFRQMLPSAAGEVLLSTVTTGTALFELFALAIVPHWRSAK